MRNIQKSSKKTSDNRKIAKYNESTGKMSFAPNMAEIRKFEPGIPGRNMEQISSEKYDYIKNVSNVVKSYYQYRVIHSNKYNTYPFFERYEDILKIIANNKNENFVFFNNVYYDIQNQSEKDLLTVIYTDPTLEYCKLYNKFKDDKVKLKEAYNTKYGFYSYKLIYMELQAAKLNLILFKDKSKSR